MPQDTSATIVAPPRVRPFLPPWGAIGFAAAAVAVILIALAAYTSFVRRAAAGESVTETLDSIIRLEAILSTAKDIETGQRGYLLTGSDEYLQPYERGRAAMSDEVADLRIRFAEGSAQRRRLDTLSAAISDKVAELAETIALRRAGNVEGALATVRSNRGIAAMDRIRSVVADMEAEERRVLGERQEEWRDAANLSSYIAWGGCALLLVLIAVAALMTSRGYRTLSTQDWIRAGQSALALRLQGDQRLDVICERVVGFLARYLDAVVGSVFIAIGDDRFRRVAGYALPAEGTSPVMVSGESLVGQAARDARVVVVDNVPPDYTAASSGTGRAPPRRLLLLPAVVDDVVQGVVELGFFRTLTPADVELATRASQTMGIALRAAKDRSRLEELLAETQQQAEELQAQQEELRVNNEELEEQSRALKEAQARGEAQQAELEQTNAHLEEQAERLEAQKNTLAKTQADLITSSDELRRSNQYKSEFLANMSHELRTPLNSSLILAGILADNKDGNLSAEQVKFAATIQSAGNELLALINDILDLSKIEAGKIELAVEPVNVRELVDALMPIFAPLAEQKHLAFHATIDPSAPETIETDRQRLMQILRNLLSNALKFTSHGEVSLRVVPANSGVAFAVRDTGIGIAAEHQESVFEAFRQADGSTHRKYGGTGLGLSISRDLARAMGGDVALASMLGSGSEFTLSLPLAIAGGVVAPRELPRAPAAPAPTPPAPAPLPPPSAPLEQTSHVPLPDDDRGRLSPETRTLLIIEDDRAFAEILRDIGRERGFQCVIALTATEGLNVAQASRPNAILLDMNLPDFSGLGVLDQLKRNPATRHVPVHVISVADYTREALERGAVGYALKPVKREQLLDAFQRLESKIAQRVRRVLVVEDDARQRESIRQLLGSEAVEIADAASGNEALAALRTSTFDCVVMDFNLPDLSGFALLNRMAEDEEVSFPPVIIYTGRALTRDEEQNLRRFAKSIIIKDARSPERLLDEVTLFLHQVEAELPVERQKMLRTARARDAALEHRRILVVEDDVRNVFALTSLLEPKGARVEIARNGREAIETLERAESDPAAAIDLVLMDIMMPEMDGLTAMREIRKRSEWRRIPIIALTAKAMRDDQEKCIAAGASDYISKPLDVDKLLSLIRIWMPK